MDSAARLEAPEEAIDFAGLDIHWDRRVLRPRPWTAEQSRWAAELAEDTPAGAILELCCGAGHIGLLAARLSERDLVQVDRDPVAASYARQNAERAGIAADVRSAALHAALGPEELFGVVIADPPWLPTGTVAQYPDDPVLAVDGGADGLDMILQCLDTSLRQLLPEGHLVLQVGVPQQAEQVSDWLAGHASGRVVTDVRDCRPGGLLVHVGPADQAADTDEEGTDD